MTTIRVPDIGDASNVTVIEVAVSPGDTVSEGDTLIVLESDKASMEIPADASGVVGTLHVKVPSLALCMSKRAPRSTRVIQSVSSKLGLAQPRSSLRHRRRPQRSHQSLPPHRWRQPLRVVLP